MYKQIVIARKDLNMSPGKLAAQVSHASMAFLAKYIHDNVVGEVFEGTGDAQKLMRPTNNYRIQAFNIDKDIYEQWLCGAYTKCVLQAKNKNQLLKAVTMAETLGMKEGVDFFVIKDNCYTELEPEEIGEDGIGRTITCVGFSPMASEVIDQIGRKYHLWV